MKLFINDAITLILIFACNCVLSCSNSDKNDVPSTLSDPHTEAPFNETEDDTPMSNPRVRMVFLKSKDIEITEDKIKRLRAIGTYTEQYYVNQLTFQGYALSNTSMFARNSDGDVLIYTVESDETTSELSDILTVGSRLAKLKYTDLNDQNSIWAIAHFKEGGGYSGGGTISGGRMKFLYKSDDGSVDFTKHAAETQFHRDINLKAIVHELGHALTLLHNGPLQNNTSNNTMMGPINNAYEATVGSATSRIILSDFSGAMLANHPIFKNKPYDESELQGKTIRIEKLSGDSRLFITDCVTTDSARIRGKVISNLPFHRVVIRFLFNNQPKQEYWAKAFAVETDQDGHFELLISKDDVNLQEGIDTFELMICFDNGLTRGVAETNTTYTFNSINNEAYVGTHAFCMD